MANDIVWDDEKPNASGIVWDDDKPTNSVGQEALRQLGLTGRALVSAVASPVTLAGDVIGKGINALTGNETIKPYSRVLQQTLTRMGLPEPQRPIEQFTQGMSEAAPAFALPGTLPAQVFGNAAVASAQARPGDELKQAVIGGGLGAAGHALARTVGGLVRPTPEARVLMDRGVALTPGQAAGVGSLTNRLEQNFSSLPVASHFISNAQRRAVEEANVAAAQTVANVVDNKLKLGLPPREAIEQTRDAISKTYDNALEGMFVPTDHMRHELTTIIPTLVDEHPMLPVKDLKQMERYIKQRLDPIWERGVEQLDGSQLKQIDSEIGQQVRRLRTSPNAADKTAAPAWADLQQSVREIMAQGAQSSEHTAQLQSANAAYRQLLAIEKSMLAGSEHFTPRQLRRTLDNAKSPIRETELNKVADAMQATLPNTVPNSGTTERLLMTGLPAMLGLSGAGATSMGYDTLGAGLIAAGALGSRPGARFLTGGYGVQPYAESVVNALRRGIPAATRQQDDQ